MRRFDVSFYDRRAKGHVTVTVEATSATGAVLRGRIEAANLVGHNDLTLKSATPSGEGT